MSISGDTSVAVLANSSNKRRGSWKLLATRHPDPDGGLIWGKRCACPTECHTHAGGRGLMGAQRWAGPRAGQRGGGGGGGGNDSRLDQHPGGSDVKFLSNNKTFKWFGRIISVLKVSNYAF